MQYRGASLPLVTLSDAAQVEPIESEGRNLAVIVSNVRAAVKWVFSGRCR